MNKTIQAPNHSQIPNSVLDNAKEYKESELRVMLCICRETFGWHRSSVKLSNPAIAERTGLSINSVIAAVDGLLNEKVITREFTNAGHIYSLVVTEEDGGSKICTPLQNLHPEGSKICTPPIKANKKDITAAPSADLIPDNLKTSPQFLAAWENWKTFRRVEKRKTVTPTTAKLQLTALACMGVDRAIAAIHYSMQQGWTGIFEDKNALKVVPAKPKINHETIVFFGVPYNVNTEPKQSDCPMFNELETFEECKATWRSWVADKQK